MTIKISNCGQDENGGYTGGAAGDQTGKEWYIRSYYNGGWTYYFRHSDSAVTKLLIQLAKEAAENDKIGYDQGQRLTFWTQLKKAGYYPSKITTKCEADCSSGVAAIVKAAGYLAGDSKLQGISTSMYTGNEKACLTGVGFTAKKFTSSSALKNGDILMSSGHTVIVTSGAGSSSSSTSSSSSSSTSSKPTYSVGKTYTTKVDRLRVRKGAGTSYAAKTKSQLTSDGQKHAYADGTLKKGTSVTCKAKKSVGSDIWMQIPSGWIAAYYDGDKYVG